MKETIKLMIVDDSSIIRKLIRNNLKTYNIEVVGEAADGKTALEMFRKIDPDIVTMDITMPEMDGIAVMEEILKINNSVKILIVTALSDKATGLEAIKKGAKGIVVKPFSPEKIQEVFARLVEHKN